MKHIRKLVSLLLVLALALTVSPSAFAAVGDIEGVLSNGTMNFSTLRSDLSAQVTDEGTASYATGLFVEPAQGTLYKNYSSEAVPGAGVATVDQFDFSTGSNSIDSVTFVPKTGYVGEPKISYTVVSTTGKSFKGTITVKAAQQQTVSVSYSSNGEAIHFQPEDFKVVTGNSINWMSFTPPDDRYGTMYYDYIDANTFNGLVESGTQYFAVRQPYISKVCFMPAEGYNGSFTISFSATDIDNRTVRGDIRITVSGNNTSSADADSDFKYSMTSGQSLSFQLSDFADACREATGYPLDYVRFPKLPDSACGKLYYNDTTAVKTSTSYYYDDGSPLLRDVSFVAEGDYAGTVTIPFTGFSTSPQQTSFNGVITIEVSVSGAASFSYFVRAGERVYIDEEGAAEIADACHELTGYQLSHVRFTSLPASSRGVLYHNSSRVSTDTRYYLSGSSNLLENINFLANDNYEGNFAIPFIAYSSFDGKTFIGTLQVEVTDAGSSSIRYSVRSGQRIDLDEDDFSDIYFRKTGRSLSYVRFSSLPASSRGVFSEFYGSDSTSVNTSTSYYLSDSTDNTHLLGNVSFTANENYSGTFTVGYTGYSTNGSSYKGEFSITVVSVTASQTPRVTYYTSGPAAQFSSSDFSTSAAPFLSDTLERVRFSEPDASAGKMYYAYTSPASNSTFVSGQSYSTTLLSQLCFLPKAGYSGTVSIPYTATDRSGNTASGTVYVVVTPPLVSSYFNDMGSTSWAVPAVDFLHNYQVVNGVSDTQYSPAANMRRGDFILMLSRAYGFSSAGTASFSDVPQNSYYAEAIASARAMGIATGDSSGLFRPNDSISRQDAAVLLYRCMASRGQNLTGTESALFGFSDSGSVASYAIDAMTALVRLGVFQGDGQGFLRPTSSLTRAEMATILYRALTY